MRQFNKCLIGLAEEKQRWIWIINSFGAAFNIAANIVLIPISGAVGAAVATLVTQVFTNVVVSYLVPDIRPNTRLMLRGITPKKLFLLIKNIKNTKKDD